MFHQKELWKFYKIKYKNGNYGKEFRTRQRIFITAGIAGKRFNILTGYL